jgi:general stress protein CsbA
VSNGRGVRELVSEFTQTRASQVIAGTFAGVGIILLAVLISALVFRAYGWGLFVLTPFVVGLATGYLVNRRELQTIKATNRLVLLSAALGCFGLILFALEGLICLILASPLAALLAIAGGALGRRAARLGKEPTGPLYCVALLPLMFAADAVSPPDALMLTDQSIVINAPASRVWRAVTSDDPISEPATLVGRLGLAYPERGHLWGTGVGAARSGYFSTGVASEKVTEWQEGRILGFVVLRQPPAMTEMSPYRHVHAPHVTGYFETGETRFEIAPLSVDKTQLTVLAAHRLRIAPIIYWEPIARWAANSNTRRVLRDLKAKAELATRS